MVEAKNEGYFEDIEIGAKMITKGRTVTEADIGNFAALTWDTYPLHTDAEYAKKTIFGERIAHGALVLSFGLGLIMSHDAASKVVAFYGIDKLRFTGPIKIGDTIHVEGEVLDKEDKGSKGGVVTTHYQIKNQHGETAIDATFRVLFAKRASDG